MARTHYIQELESVRQNLIQMGETTVSLLGEALHAATGDGSATAEQASQLEFRTDRQLRTIRDQCLSLITLQAPVARDARLITGILDAIVDLELIGDYSYEIVTIGLSMKQLLPHPVMNQVSEVFCRTRDALLAALGAWCSVDASEALSAGPQVAAIRADCHTLYEKLSQLASTAGDAMPYLNVLLICHNLERISQHAACIGEQAVGAAPMSRSAINA
jgi:phosphate transport system protein